MTSREDSHLVIIESRGEAAEWSVLNIQQHRHNKGLTQEQLSGLAALDRTHYSKIERGLRSPTIETLFKIADALDVQPHELVAAIEKATADD